MNLDQVMKRIRETDATIFTVGVGRTILHPADAGGGMGQARNSLICRRRTS